MRVFPRRSPHRLSGSLLAVALAGSSLAIAPQATAADTTADPSADSGADSRAGTTAGTAGARKNATQRKIQWQAAGSAKQLKRARLAATKVKRGRVLLDVAADPVGTRRAGSTTYDVGRWTSRWVEHGFAFTELIASWEAKTPGDSWIEVAVRPRGTDGTMGSWDVLGRWASGDRFLERTTLGSQSDDLGRVNVDTWVASQRVDAYRLQVSLMRKSGARTNPPSLGMIGAVTSRLPSGPVSASKPGVVARAGGAVLDVPTYSQMIHEGHYPQYGNGGEAWCSPTSTSMVLAYFDALPSEKEYSWVGSGHQDPWVDHAARMTFDHGYDGAGNWPFNTAYASRQTDHAFVTRLRSMREAEKLVAAGIPVVISIAFDAGQLSGAPISSSNGHLLVVVGFTGDGDVVVNDPAGASNGAVRRTYDRGQLENAWLPRSGGTAYVIHDAATSRPKGSNY